MEFDRMLAWGVLCAITLLFFSISAYGLSKRGRRRGADDFVQRIGLVPGDDQMQAIIATRTSSATRASTVGVLVGLSVAVLVLLLVPTWQSPSAIVFVVLPPMLLGIAGGGVVSALKNTLFVQKPDASRVARASSPGLDDYVDGGRRTAPNVLLGLATLITIAAVLLAASGWVVHEARA